MPEIVGYRVGNIATLSPEFTDSVEDGGRRRVGLFQSSSRVLNQIYDTSMWTKSNLVTGGMSVDCPHRERLGYIGDAHTTLETSLQNFNSLPFYEKWTQDIIDIQGYPAHSGHVCDSVEDCGYIAHTAPTVDGGGGPGWSGFICVMPWQVYLAYGDTRIIELAYPAQTKLIRFWQRSVGSDGLVMNWGGDDKWSFLGDWLTPHGSEQSASIEASLFNNCYILYCTRIVAQISHVLDKQSNVDKFKKQADDLAKAIHAKFFVSSNNGYIDTLQTHLTMALAANVPPPQIRADVMDTLRNEIMKTQNGHIDTGLHGTYFMTKLLYDTSHTQFGGGEDLIKTYVLTPTFPGYVDLLDKGYTTWPEAWGNCMTPNTSVTYQCKHWLSGSLSQMHGTLNGIGQWFVGGLGGIRRSEGGVGMQQFELRPSFGLVNTVTASYVSDYGRVVSSYGTDSTALTLSYNVTVPPNTKASIYLQATTEDDVQESGVPVSQAPGVKFMWCKESTCVFQLGSGSYKFTTKM
eukprot:m.120654 g.120654  ORF g.120654 m.120654 type:complete len:517 (-) comp28822_c0_seq2:151-1701(-)